MGKYMKKSKTTSDIGVMEVTEPTALGVRTRAAKTLALKRLNSSSVSAQSGGSSCYLQLRSRRLEKPPSLAEQKQLPRHLKSGIKESGSRPRVDSDTAASGSVPLARSCKGDKCFGDTEVNSVSAEVSFGENSLDFESRYSTRESTPCNFVEDMDIIFTPGSSTRSMRSATKDYTRDRDSMVPTTSELEEFFTYAEQQQQRLFMEKYNFDIVNDMPLTGRYEWVQVTP